MSVLVVPTDVGEARATLAGPARDAAGLLVLGHGAGGLRWTDDVLAVRDVAVDRGWRVALVDQPWRVAGKRMGPGPARLDPVWLAVVSALPPVRPLVVGGRSAGARVACRTAALVGADAVLALSFPLHPPGRPERSRAPELAAPSATGVPVHLVHGERDPFGAPGEVRAALPEGADLRLVPGTHSLEAAAAEVGRCVAAVLDAVAAQPRAE
ncbi:hypothetical protein KC207_10830 [Phycicoccus sp. BSK3Z-2]|uniref:KANL3/Tex30 alpha/beta hydrolase-like domain-containing protein n=1 Tax=Phycicoccus avicenniae TaxID=2828860 RepID=A0A941D817_9MICO|nr:alpha/beta family hydrolase [Phycicoccus avicenniae]MBR7743784.1 hypothetical protein [Phycicoccus avicenniae]